MFITRARRSLLAAFVTLASALPAQAAGFLYDCTMSDLEQGYGWVSPKIAIVLPEDGSVQIVDALTLAFAKEPVQGTVLRNNTQRLIVKWTLQNVRADNGRSFANFDYRASIAKRTGTMELTGGPRTFDIGLRSAGSCVRRSE